MYIPSTQKSNVCYIFPKINNYLNKFIYNYLKINCLKMYKISLFNLIIQRLPKNYVHILKDIIYVLFLKLN